MSQARAFSSAAAFPDVVPLIQRLGPAGTLQQGCPMRYGMNPDGESCEFAIVVAGRLAGQGYCQAPHDPAFMEIAKARGFKIMEDAVLTENVPMPSLVKPLGFNVQPMPDSPSVSAVSRAL